MADDPKGPPDGSKPAIPDLKKAQLEKPAPFAWSPGAPVARAAASAAAAAGRTRAPATLMERLATTPGKLAVLALLMLIGGAGLSVTSFHDSGTGGGVSGGLGGVKSTIKFHAGRGRDSTAIGIERDDSRADRLIKGKTAAEAAAGLPAMPAIPAIPGMAGAEADAPMNYEEGATSRGAGVAAGAAAAAAPGGGAASAEGAGATAGSAGPKLGSSSFGNIKFQGMRRVSQTSGFRGIKAGGAPSKVIQGRGSSTNAPGAGGAAGADSRGLPLTPFSTDASRSAAASGGKGGKGGGAAAADGGGGGGEADPGDLEENVDNAKTSIPDLMDKARSLREAADKEEKKAKVLAALGQAPQAYYHYDRAKKKKKQAEGYEAQANEQLNVIKNDAAALTTTPKP